MCSAARFIDLSCAHNHSVERNVPTKRIPAPLTGILFFFCVTLFCQLWSINSGMLKENRKTTENERLLTFRIFIRYIDWIGNWNGKLLFVSSLFQSESVALIFLFNLVWLFSFSLSVWFAPVILQFSILLTLLGYLFTIAVINNVLSLNFRLVKNRWIEYKPLYPVTWHLPKDTSQFIVFKLQKSYYRQLAACCENTFSYNNNSILFQKKNGPIKRILPRPLCKKIWEKCCLRKRTILLPFGSMMLIFKYYTLIALK